MKLFIIITSVFILASCASTPPLLTSNTMEIIHQAADKAPNGFAGVYTFHIRATGEQRGDQRVFLNTELDYRDQRNVTVALAPNVAFLLEKQFGAAPIKFFKDKTIQVTGEARRVKIYFSFMGRRTEKYYYQTQLKVTEPSQIKLVAE